MMIRTGGYLSRVNENRMKRLRPEIRDLYGLTALLCRYMRTKPGRRVIKGFVNVNRRILILENGLNEALDHNILSRTVSAHGRPTRQALVHGIDRYVHHAVQVGYILEVGDGFRTVAFFSRQPLVP